MFSDILCFFVLTVALFYFDLQQLFSAFNIIISLASLVLVLRHVLKEFLFNKPIFQEITPGLNVPPKQKLLELLKQDTSIGQLAFSVA